MTANEMKYNLYLLYDKAFEYAAPSYDDRQASTLLTKAQHRVFRRKYMPNRNRFNEGFENSEQRRSELQQLIRPVIINGAIVTGSGTYSVTWATSNSITTVTVAASPGVGSTIGLNPGQTVTGTGIGPVGTTTIGTIKSIISTTQFILEAASSTATQASPVNITGGLGKSAFQGGVHSNGKFYDLPSNFLYAIEESLVTNVSTPDEIKVLPVTHDYYRANIKNPYKKPYSDLAWRMDFSREDYGEDGGDAYTDRTPKRCEVITAAATTVSSYRLRYLMQPPAIVCDELDPSNQRHCILDESLHNEIVDEAVKIAVAATTPETYQISDKEQKENEF